MWGMAGMHFLDPFFSAQKLGRCSDGCLVLGSVGLERGGFVMAQEQGLSQGHAPYGLERTGDVLCKPTPWCVFWGMEGTGGIGKSTSLGIAQVTEELAQPGDLVSSTVAYRVSVSLQITSSGL